MYTQNQGEILKDGQPIFTSISTPREGQIIITLLSLSDGLQAQNRCLYQNQTTLLALCQHILAAPEVTTLPPKLQNNLADTVSQVEQSPCK